MRRFSASRKRGVPEWERSGPMRGMPNGEPGLCRFGDYQSLRPGVRRVGAMGTVWAGAAGPAGSIMIDVPAGEIGHDRDVEPY